MVPKQRMDDVLAMARLADEAGLDVFGLGEHHTPQYTVSATATVLAAAAAITKGIRLTSASTLLSTADPVRTFEEFATVDLISGGRAEVPSSMAAGVNVYLYSTSPTSCAFTHSQSIVTPSPGPRGTGTCPRASIASSSSE